MPFPLGYSFRSISVLKSARSLFLINTPTGRQVTKHPNKKEFKDNPFVEVKRVRCRCSDCKRMFTTTVKSLEIPGRGKMGCCDKCGPAQYIKYRNTVWPSMRALSAELQIVAHSITDRMRDDGVSLRKAIEHVKREPRKPIERGDVFAQLTVRKPGKKHLTWVCKCTCGKRVIVRSCNLYSLNTKSCGCRRIQSAKANGLALRKYTDREYTIGRGTHSSMMKRCYTKTHKSYPRYGARGITVHKPWHKCERFLRELCEEIGPRPRGCSLDRVNNDKGYKPGNVKWSTQKQQNNNRSNNVTLTYKGKTRNIQQWAELSKYKKRGITASMMYYRKSLGKTADEILR